MIKNIIANFFGKFWSILSNFFFIPLYIHFLGFESYSIISFTLVIAGLMAVFDAGLSGTLSREFARTDNTKEDKVRIFKTLESTYFIIICVVIFIVFSFSELIAEKWLNLNTYSSDKVSLLLKIISFDIGFQLLFRFYMGGLLGLEKQVKANFYQISWGILRNGLVIIPLIFIPRLELFFIWQTVSTVIFTILIKVVLEKSLMGHSKFDLTIKIEKDVFKSIWKFAGGMLLIAFVSSINTQMDKLAISNLLSIESLGYYTLAISLSQGLFVLVNPISTALLPRFTALYSAKRVEDAANMYRKTSMFVSVIVFSFMANMIVFSKDLIWIWTGKMELAEHVYMLIPVVALSYAMYSLQLLPYGIAIANGYTKLNNILGMISLLVTLPGYWLATMFFDVLGAAVVFCSVQTITTFVYLFFINKKFIKTNIVSTIYLKQIIIPLIISLLFAYVFSLIPDIAENGRWISLMLIGASTLVTLILTALILIPLKELKKVVKYNVN